VAVEQSTLRSVDSECVSRVIEPRKCTTEKADVVQVSGGSIGDAEGPGVSGFSGVVEQGTHTWGSAQEPGSP
jgi:hypothetical protein